ncbi:MAG TPA: hypothetical protein VJT31_24965, partial [Rugosimonospora sp.]|nr:hypothetical protein [Rugosimonospora sp.]
MTERDEPAERRRRPSGPAWATVPTMQWQRVPEQRVDSDDDELDEPPPPPHIARRRGRGAPPPDRDESVPVSPAVSLGPRNPPRPPGRGVARPGGSAR